MNASLLGQTKEIGSYIKPLPLPLLPLLLPPTSPEIEQPKETFIGNYLVTKIHVANDCYLIFLKDRNDNKYTIYSKKEMLERTVYGKKIHPDSIYFFELTYIPSKFNPVSSFAITNSYGFTQFETGYICSAKNLIGLTITSMENVNKAKNKRKK